MKCDLHARVVVKKAGGRTLFQCKRGNAVIVVSLACLDECTIKEGSGSSTESLIVRVDKFSKINSSQIDNSNN